ncbi:MAG: hypothetical protein MJY56_00290 [Bacteroidales bacterium]|nr:hypothetical protein [Bacteroidales bacterium]
MKKLFLIVAACAALSLSAIAQPKDDGWKDRMKAEKIAFITTELNLTPEEAQKFWPVYNEQEQIKMEAMKAVHASHSEMKEALEADKKVAKAVDNYVEALEKNSGVEAEAIKQYRKVLPEEKVAKLLLAEENFRKSKIRSFNNATARPQGSFHSGNGQHGGFRGFFSRPFGGHSHAGHAFPGRPQGAQDGGQKTEQTPAE